MHVLAPLLGCLGFDEKLVSLDQPLISLECSSLSLIVLRVSNLGLNQVKSLLHMLYFSQNFSVLMGSLPLRNNGDLSLLFMEMVKSDLMLDHLLLSMDSRGQFLGHFFKSFLLVMRIIQIFVIFDKPDGFMHFSKSHLQNFQPSGTEIGSKGLSLVSEVSTLLPENKNPVGTVLDPLVLSNERNELVDVSASPLSLADVAAAGLCGNLLRDDMIVCGDDSLVLQLELRR